MRPIANANARDERFMILLKVAEVYSWLPGQKKMKTIVFDAKCEEKISTDVRSALRTHLPCILYNQRILAVYTELK